MSFQPQIALDEVTGQPVVARDSGRDRDNMGGSSRSGSAGGYTGVRDMLDGGGPGRSGATFSGGGRISGMANAAGISPVGRDGGGGMGRGK